MDIEDRAALWARENAADEYRVYQDQGFDKALIDAYLAGVNQARQDEEAHRAHLGS